MGLGSLADRSFDAVIFDMDGTLIDSTPAVLRSWKTWAIEHDVPPADLLQHHGIPSAGVVRLLLAEDRQASAIQRINELELADVRDIVVLPGAVDALSALRDAKNAIATSCTIPLAKARIEAAELVPPSVLVTADDVQRGKPAPDPYLEAAARLGVDPSRCLVVEDAPAGTCLRSRGRLRDAGRGHHHAARRSWTPTPSCRTCRTCASASTDDGLIRRPPRAS